MATAAHDVLEIVPNPIVIDLDDLTELLRASLAHGGFFHFREDVISGLWGPSRWVSMLTPDARGGERIDKSLGVPSLSPHRQRLPP